MGMSSENGGPGSDTWIDAVNDYTNPDWKRWKKEGARADEVNSSTFKDFDRIINKPKAQEADMAAMEEEKNRKKGMASTVLAGGSQLRPTGGGMGSVARKTLLGT